MTDGTARAWGWVAHLQSGGATPWQEWTGTADPRGAVVPGAQQLELLRRLNQAGRTSPALADRVLAADPPRRSRPGLPLVGGPPVPDHGPRPVDPAELDDNELTRLTAVLLADDLAGHELRPPRRVLRRPWRIRYHLFGDPEYTAPLRRHLTTRGRPPGGYGGQVVVVGTDTGRMLVDLWTAHCFRHGAVPWGDWIDRRAGRGTLPRPLDLHLLAVTEADRPGPHRVHVVTDPALATRLLGVRRGPQLPSPPAAAVAVDLGRRISGALRPRATWDRRSRLITEVLRPRLADAPGMPLVVPARHREWAAGEAARLHHQLGRGRYPVHGGPALVLPVERAGVEEPDPSGVLELALRLLRSRSLTTEPTEEAS